MISKGRKRVLEVFMDSPLDELHLREISRRAGIAINNTYKYLYQFVDKGFLMVRERGNKKFFRVNLKNEFLLKTLEYLELERRERFFGELPGMEKLKDAVMEIRGVMSVNMILFDRREGDVIVVVNGEGIKSDAMRIISMGEFRKVADEDLLRNRVVLYNEFEFWRALSEF